MKQTCYLLFLLFFLACNTNSKYEKAIAEYVQTDSKGTKYDMKFKVLEILETKYITVQDSVSSLKDAFEADKAKKISGLEESLKSNEASLEKEKNSRVRVLVGFYEKQIETYKHLIDSLKLTTPAAIQKYENRKPDERLAITVRCRYSAVPPIINTRVEETADFLLTPDGQKCYGQRRIKAD